MRMLSDAAALPARRAVDIVADKWVIAIIERLASDQASHFNRLTRDLPGLSRNILSRTLRSLERDGLVAKHTLAGPLPASRYELTDDGRRVSALIGLLGAWASINADLLEAVVRCRTSTRREAPDGRLPVARCSVEPCANRGVERHLHAGELRRVEAR